LTYLSSTPNKAGIKNTSSSIILTIAVPTYNRESELTLLFENLASRLVGFWSRIEIIVSDNCSLDETWSVIQNFNRNYGNIIRFRAFRQERNLGPHRNVTFLMDKALGEFIWTIADDDLIAEKAVENIFQYLEQSTTKTLLVRAEGIGEWDKITVSRDACLKKSIESSHSDYVQYLAAGSFLASTIFRASEYPIYKKLISELVDTNYPHLILFWHILSKQENISVIDTVCVQGNANFSGISVIPSFGVLVHARGIVWDSLIAGCKIKDQLQPYICRLYLEGWLSIILGRSNDVQGFSLKVIALRNTWSILRMRGWRAYVLFLVSVILPIPKILNSIIFLFSGGRDVK
jgi:glycosyltransferase involved in cell wall biosynthesis